MVRCTRDSAGPWEKFKTVALDGKSITLKGGRGDKYCSDEQGRVVCNRDTVGAWEKFTWAPWAATPAAAAPAPAPAAPAAPAAPLSCASAKSKYLADNPDVKNAGVDAWAHFQSSGQKEGRKWAGASCTSVCTNAKTKYLADNPDVKNAGVDAWQHYQSNGW